MELYRMRNIMTIGIMLVLANITVAQELDSNSLVKKSKNSWYRNPASTKDVAQYIYESNKGDLNRVRAIYNWVIQNIKYDKDSSRIINAGIDPEARINVAFKRRKGVCENFAAIFNDICNRAGLHSLIINGYTQQNGTVDKEGHVWCAVFINRQWHLVDPTWDVGNTSNPQYFMIPPARFIETHMPFDPMWQLLEHPVTHEKFYKNAFYIDEKTPYFNYTDSIIAYFKMDSLQQIKSAMGRIEKMSLYNKRIKENYLLLKSHAEMQYQDEQIEYYNAAVADLNEATSLLNQFIKWRNDTLKNAGNESNLQQLLDDVDTKINTAFAKMDVVDRSKAKLVFGTAQARERLQSIMKKNQDQHLFFKKYLATPLAERPALFY